MNQGLIHKRGFKNNHVSQGLVSQWRAFPSLSSFFSLSLSLSLYLAFSRSLSTLFRFGPNGLGTTCRASKMAPGRAVDERALDSRLCGILIWLGHQVAHPRNPGDCHT